MNIKDQTNQCSKLLKFDLFTILIAAYMVNMFHFNFFVEIQTLLTWCISGGYLFLNNKIVLSLFFSKKNRNFLSISAVLLLLYLLLVITPILYSKDYTYFLEVCKIFLALVYYLVIVVRLKKKYPDRDLFESFIQIYIYVVALYVLVTLLMINVPSVKQFIINIIEVSSFEKKLINNPYYFTRIGWGGFSGYSNSIKCTIACCFVLYLIIKNIFYHRRSGIFLYVLLIVLLIGNMCYARTGLIISVVCLIIAILFIGIKQRRIWHFIKYSLIIIGLFIGVYYFVIKFAYNNLSLQWVFEALFNYWNGKGFSTSSTTTLMDMYFMPKLATFLFGDGYYTSASGYYYMNTDVGIMRLILYFGIFGALLTYWIMFYNIWGLHRKNKKINYNVLPIFFVVVFIGFELKGESIFLLMPLFFTLNLIKNN